MNKIKIATFQSKVYTKKYDNINQLSKMLKRDDLNCVDIVTLPEMFNCPYETSNFPVYAEMERGETWQACSELAREHKIYLSAGSIPEIDNEGHVYNTAYVFDREGKQIGKHRKMHLFDISISGGQYFKESDTLTGGDQITVFDTEFCVMGLCICYDFRFPELAMLMADKGAKVIIVPAAFNMTTGPAHWETMFRQRAVDNQVYAIGTAPARNMESSYTSWGHSIITGPWGDVIMQMNEKENIKITEIDLDVVDKVREELPLLKHRRKNIYSLVQKLL